MNQNTGYHLNSNTCDANENTPSLTNSSERTSNSYSYDTFDNLADSTGTTPHFYLYAHEQYDVDLTCIS